MAVLAAAACGTGTATAQTQSKDSATAAATTHSSSGHRTRRVASPPAGARATAARKPLAGKTIGIDPGHNGRNKDDPTYINKPIWNGREWEPCDTTGTETDGGYTEAKFNFNVASDLRGDLQKLGAKVVLTRPDNRGVGPCVNRRARILNRAHSSVAVDIHADGGPPSGRGFTVLEPVADGPNDGVIASSVRFGADVHAAMLAGTSMPVADYYGENGYISRDDLAGLNLTTVPKVLIECVNMRNAADASRLVEPSFQRLAARSMADAITAFLAPR